MNPLPLYITPGGNDGLTKNPFWTVPEPMCRIHFKQVRILAGTGLRNRPSTTGKNNILYFRVVRFVMFCKEVIGWPIPGGMGPTIREAMKKQ